MTAEWITERPDIDFKYDPLADFETMEFTNSYSYTNISNTGYSSAGADGARQIQMTNCAITQDLLT
ncbi:MAG TPA: G1 family glutamic endopeptidase [Pseudonocardiaceae bacterium]